MTVREQMQAFVDDELTKMHSQRISPNSAMLWLPVVERLGLPSPKTVIFFYDHSESMNEDGHYFKVIVDKAKRACNTIGYPCFIRTDLTSAKHSGPRSYLARTEDEVAHVIGSTIEDNEIKLGFQAWPMAIMVREFLDLDAAFTAPGYGGFPVAREWRLFASGEGVKCRHPYWPEDAVEQGGPLPDNWREVLADHHTVPAIMNELEVMAVKVTAELGGEWSIDFSCDRTGKWWLTDMATARESFHWPQCPTLTKLELF